ncbi:hypothetical protein [Gracilibacillus sp. YIM 98692]|uniref:hypothetical protein n=1 Tax=Gracilibacillus sp. YIM 98692 TaxID=2663532 RepID=UPI0013D4F3F4|nr:hypothetical protein [Gracilibacillus sp. YIM 98692]
MIGEWTLLLIILGSIWFGIFTVTHLLIYTMYFGLIYLFTKKFLFQNSIMFGSIKRLIIARAIIFTLCSFLVELIGWIFYQKDFNTRLDWFVLSGFSYIYIILILAVGFYLYDFLTTVKSFTLSNKVKLVTLCAHELALSVVIIILSYPMYWAT